MRDEQQTEGALQMPVRPISTAGRAEPAENEALVTSQGFVAIHGIRSENH